ncbi:PD-(D/E)XK nuclease family protein [Xylanibacter ruminicola]|uniref:RecB family exonuclease n=1 Tax=Xylanibacter ruminicola TaxID=839 RepID=A0A1M6VTL0_XYLRU|nr:PD-(D/E)XK nuclease family protein [Xylanibacter ruminicola]SHK84817.1 RecB family exonuclease [Xylanibacter ruminicola]
MKSFLEHVAEDLLSRYGTNLSRVAVVFPNKRASLFLNEHLARLAGKPIWSPAYITISDLFRSHSSLQVADPILLVCELHQVFTACTGIDETLDHFYGWGQLLLSDFDDLDKNMAPADKVLANLRDIHELDDTSYLTPEQREMIKRFFSNFSDEHNTELKERFLRLWSHIGEIYHQFNAQLAEKQLAYEGALYRQVATDESIEFEYDTYVFIGFNLLQQVEQTLFRRLEQQGKAIFYQDTDEVPPQHINYISAPTENIQARYISEWLNADRIKDGRRTAIVLCNEGLLQTVIHCLPENVEKINITTGYPLSQTSIASLINTLINMQVHGYSLRKQKFTRRWVESIKRHPYASIMSQDFADTRYTEIQPLLHWLISITQTIAVSKSPIIDSPLDTESLFRMYTLLNRLSGLVDSGILMVDVITLQRLISQLITTTSIPFHGEPAEGIQVMGVLETRNLDFDHVLLLSCNEGNMPRGVNDTSFIPYALRKAYGLTTVDYKVAIYQHYFHRLLQRASDVTILYNNATSDGKTAEMSRFMLQLMVENKIPITFQTLKAGQMPQIHAPKPIEKTPEVIAQMQKRFSKEEGGISPTAINNYLRCQLRFFYRYICGINEPDNTDEDMIDNRLFGNIFHKAAQLIYERFGKNTISSMMIDDLLKEEVSIERAVDEAIKQEFFKIDDPSRPLPPLDGLQLINREVIIKYIRQLLEVDRRHTPFRILGLEKWVDIQIGNLKVGGIIDRLDSIHNPKTGEDQIRVLDYKTGSRNIKPLPDIATIFSPEAIKDHSDYFLQTFLYAHIVRTRTTNQVAPCLLFIQHAGGQDYDPTLAIGKEPVTDIATYSGEFINMFQDLLAEMFNPQLSFTPTDDRRRCETCPFASLCRG